MNLQSNLSADTAWRTNVGNVGALMGLNDASQEPLARARSLQQATENHLPSLARQPAPAESRQEVPIDEINFCALRTLQEISAIKYLRGELNLSASVLTDPEFELLEKKETSTGWWAHSAAVTSLSGRFASFQ